MNLQECMASLVAPSAWPPGGAKRMLGAAYRRLPRSWRQGGRYAEFRSLAEAGEGWTVEEVQPYQIRQLRQVLIQAGNYCPFYQDAFAKTAFRPEMVKDFADLRDCPFLERNDLAAHLPQLLSKAIPEKERLATRTGTFLHRGVTGPKQQAFREAQWKRGGWFEGARLAVLGGPEGEEADPASALNYDPARDRLLLSSSHLKPERLAEYLEALDRFRPELLCATPAAAAQLAGLLQQAGLNWRQPLRGLLCGPEPLARAEKERLAGIFKCGVHRWYEPTEPILLAGEGRNSNLLYFWPQYGYIEFGGADAAGWCEIIATSFHNLVMPLIRFRTGVYARLADPRQDGDLEFPWAAAAEIKETAGRETSRQVAA
jgi:phenylacetate-CoA ligase